MSKLSRRAFAGLAGAGLAGTTMASPGLIRSALAQSPEVTLKLHHMLPPVSSAHKAFLKPWADRLMAASNNRIKVEIYPSMQLGGTPPQLYDQVRDGIADMIWTVQGYTPGRFPKTEVFELPFVASKRSIVNAQAVTEFAEKHLADEYKDAKIITIWAHDQGVLHTAVPVAKLEDLAGLKIRAPTRLAGQALKALGATPIGMPVPQVPEALAQKVIDGCVIPWEVVPAVKVQELVKYHLEIPDSPTFYVATFVFAMNNKVYNAMPADLRKIVDDHSSFTGAKMAGTAWDTSGVPIRAMVEKRGNEIRSLTAEQKARWVEACKPVQATWLADMKAKGVDGEGLLADATALIAKYEKAS